MSSQKIVGIVLIVIAAVLAAGVLALWMMPAMMGGMMGGMMGSTNEYMGLYTLGSLVLAAVLIALAVVLLRRSGARNGEEG